MNWGQDIHYALRALASRPLYALASIAVLAIAIGANTTVFSVFNGLFLRPLPYPDGDRLVMVYDSYPKIRLAERGHGDSRLSRAARAGAVAREPCDRRVGRRARCRATDRRSACSIARASRFAVRRAAGRARRSAAPSRTDEATLGNERVAVLSHGLWSTRFGARPRHPRQQHSARRRVVSRDRRHAARTSAFRTATSRPICRSRSRRSSERRGARQPVFDQRRPPARRRHDRRLERRARQRSCSATSRTGDCPPTP